MNTCYDGNNDTDEEPFVEAIGSSTLLDLACWTGIIIEVSAEVFKEFVHIFCIHCSIAVKVTAALVFHSAGTVHPVSREIIQES